jgi:putative flippase GtrA
VRPRLSVPWLRLWRYSASSVIAALTSAVVFAAVYAVGAGTLAANVLAFLAGAVPNWVLNRTWAWQRRGRVRVRREVLLYAVVSLLSLLASTTITTWVGRVAPSVTSDRAAQVALVAGAYVATYGVLFVAKYLIYDLVVFAGDSSAARSRHEVASTTRPKRRP